MPHKQNDYAVYELQGNSLQAAQTLRTTIAERWKQQETFLSTKFSPIDDEILQKTGLRTPVICVTEKSQNFPRAYQKYPEIFLTPEQKPRYIMFSPVGHDGKNFEPANSRKLNAQETEAMGQFLFAGGWLGNAPLVPSNDQGVALPDSFTAQPQSHLSENFSKANNSTAVFLAAGKTLDLIHDFQTQQAQWKNAIERTIQAIKDDINTRKDEILADLPDGEDIYINTSYSHHPNNKGPIEIHISVRKEGKVSPLSAGEPVILPPSPAYTATTAQHGGEYAITPRTDTAEGQKIAALFDAIPETPSLNTYPELCADYPIEHDDFTKILGVNGKTPNIQTIGDHVFLTYTAAADAKSDFCPPDAMHIPANIFNWIKQDKEDQNLGIRPPPAPADVAQFIPDNGPSLRHNSAPDDQPTGP